MGRCRLFRTNILFFLIVSFLGPVLVHAGDTDQRPSTSKRAYHLGLAEVTRLALENNFDIQIARYDAWVDAAQGASTRSIYDTFFNADVNYEKDKLKRTSTIFGGEVIENNYNIGLSKKIPMGTTLSTGLENNRTRSDSSFATSAVTHESTLTFGVEQELGRNFFGVQDRGNVKLSQLEIERSRYTSWRFVEDSLAQIQKAYWDLAYAYHAVQIETEMLDQARQFYELHQQKLEVGAVELPDVIASEANYRESQADMILAEDRYETQSNNLKFLLNISDDDILIVPDDSLKDSTAAINLNVSMKNAFEKRRDYQFQRNFVEAKKINLTMKKNSLWPEINVTATLARNGLGDHFETSVTNTTQEDNVDFFAGIKINLPIENTSARAQAKAARLEDAQALLLLKQIERRIMIDINDQFRHCQVLKEVALHQENVSGLQSDKLDEEKKRFQSGRSQTDVIIRYQEDSLKAKQKSLQAWSDYYKSLIDLQVREGTLLEQHWKDSF